MAVGSVMTDAFAKVLDRQASRSGAPVMQEAARKGAALANDSLKLNAGPKGVRGLISRFHQVEAMPSPADVAAQRAAEQDAALSKQFPIWAKNKQYVSELTGNTVKIPNAQRLEQIQALTDPQSGIHKLAASLSAVIKQAPGADSQLDLAQVMKDSVGISDAEVAKRTAGVMAQVPAVQFYPNVVWHYSWDPLFTSPVSAEQFQAVNRQVAAMPGLPDAMKLSLDQANSAAEAAMPGLHPQKRSVMWGIFKKAPLGNHILESGNIYTNADVQRKINTAYQDGFKAAAAYPLPEPVAPAVADPAALKQSLLGQLLDMKVRQSNDWKVYSNEDWVKYQQQINQVSDASTMANSSVSRNNPLSALINGKKQQSSSEVVSNATTQDAIKGQVEKSVDSPVAGTNIQAPRVSVNQILQNPGDYIVASKGNVYVANSQNPADWFAIAKNDLRHS